MTTNSFDNKAREWDQPPRRLEMASIFADRIRGQIPLSTTMDLLEFGCGTGQVSLQFSPSVRRIHLVDTSPGMLEVLQEKIRDRSIVNMEPHCGEIFDLPLAEGRFDLIYSLMALHHIPAIPPLLLHFQRLLKKGGHLCIGDLEPEDGLFHEANIEVHHGFAIPELSRLIEESGFAVTAAERMHILHKTDRNGRLRDYPLFFLAARKT
jgi:ubiquinone/menaquinone biosynthesis C-methylase UbiE